MFSLMRSRPVLIVGVALMSSAWAAKAADVGVNLLAYNHSAVGIASYDVELSTGAALGAGFIGPGQGGGAINCCVKLPPAWSPGLAATVRKIVVDNEGKKTVIKTVAVPRYDASLPNHLTVHFLRDGKVKVFVTKYLLGHQQYPLRGKEAEMVPGVPLKIRWK